MSGIPEFQQRQIERWCRGHVRVRSPQEVRVECRRRRGSVTILERRTSCSDTLDPDWSEQRIAQLRLDAAGRWSLYWAGRNGRWHPVPGAPEATTPVPLLDEIDRNPNGVFWG